MGDPKKVLQLNAYDTHFIEVWNNSETKQQVVDELKESINMVNASAVRLRKYYGVELKQLPRR